MPPIRSLHLALWAAYALAVAVNIGGVMADAEMVQRVSQPLFAPLLLAVLLTAAPHRSRTTTLLICGLLCAWAGDTLGQLMPQSAQLVTVAGFLGALILYAAALAPLWVRTRDAMRIALAIPYGAVVVGLFVACADGAGSLLFVVAAYALALAVTAFLSAGGNGLTWSGGTLFLLSSSLLAMDWFLPGASIAYSTELVMLTYTLGHALLIAGMIRLMPRRRWTTCTPGAALVIVES
ncbi:MAG: lysoplasmalogenase family protein [Brachybacterium sp.]|nr:lysoplasmalogenase family protein [Brachybacterium sp.]MDN6399005.1 lysoplasmalogenase family protein [Brachybacterium sp.]